MESRGWHPIKKLTLTFFLGMSTACPAQAGLRDALAPLLPPALKKLQPGRSTEKEARATLGVPASVSTDGTTLYYELAGKKYDTTVGLSDGKVNYVLFEPESSRIGPEYTLEKLRPFITASQISQAMAAVRGPPISHDTGRYLVILSASEGLRLKFLSATDRRKLVSVLMMAPGRTNP